MNQPPASTVRSAILDALPPDTSTHGAPLEPPHLYYLSNAHTKALQLAHGLVIGGRGVGFRGASPAAVLTRPRGRAPLVGLRSRRRCG